MQLVDLVVRAKDGDEAAYGELIRRFQAMAFGYSFAVLGDYHLAQDAAQEAFLEAHGAIRKMDVPAAFPAFLRRIVHKHCDRLTRRKQLLRANVEALRAAMLAKYPDVLQETQRRVTLEEERAARNLASVIEAQTNASQLMHPMVLVSATTFLGLGKLTSYETLRGQGKLTFLDTLEQLVAFREAKKVIFLSDSPVLSLVT